MPAEPSPANRPVGSPADVSPSIATSHVPAPQIWCVAARDGLFCPMIRQKAGARSRVTELSLLRIMEQPALSGDRFVLPSPGRATPLVKSRTSAGICRNLNRILCFHDAHGLSEIGFVRRVLPISPAALSSSARFSTPSGQFKGTSARASQAAVPETYWAHTRHTWHASARAKYAEYVPRMRSDDGIARPTRDSCQIATTALGPIAILTLASATSAMIGRTA